jgi:hypothetical protein
VALEPAEQRRQLAGNAGIDAQFVNHGVPLFCFSFRSRAKRPLRRNPA